MTYSLIFTMPIGDVIYVDTQEYATKHDASAALKAHFAKMTSGNLEIADGVDSVIFGRMTWQVIYRLSPSTTASGAPNPLRFITRSTRHEIG